MKEIELICVSTGEWEAFGLKFEAGNYYQPCEYVRTPYCIGIKIIYFCMLLFSVQRNLEFQLLSQTIVANEVHFNRLKKYRVTDNFVVKNFTVRHLLHHF